MRQERTILEADAHIAKLCLEDHSIKVGRRHSTLQQQQLSFTSQSMPVAHMSCVRCAPSPPREGSLPSCHGAFSCLLLPHPPRGVCWCWVCGVLGAGGGVVRLGLPGVRHALPAARQHRHAHRRHLPGALRAAGPLLPRVLRRRHRQAGRACHPHDQGGGADRLGTWQQLDAGAARSR